MVVMFLSVWKKNNSCFLSLFLSLSKNLSLIRLLFSLTLTFSRSFIHYFFPYSTSLFPLFSHPINFFFSHQFFFRTSYFWKSWSPCPLFIFLVDRGWSGWVIVGYSEYRLHGDCHRCSQFHERHAGTAVTYILIVDGFMYRKIHLLTDCRLYVDIDLLRDTCIYIHAYIDV